MSDQAPETSKNLQNASSSRKRPPSPAVALAPAPAKQPYRGLKSLSLQPKTRVAATVRQRTQTHNRTPTPRPRTPVVKIEIDVASMRKALPAPARSLGTCPALADKVAKPEDDQPPVVGRPPAATYGAAHTDEAVERENAVAGNVKGEPAADEQAPADIPAGNEAGEGVPQNDGGAETAHDEGRLQFNGRWNFTYRGRRFLYVQGSKHEGRLVQCETCGDRFLVGVYKEKGQRMACANDDIDGHACLSEANAGEPAGQEPKTPAFEDFRIVMNPDGSIAFRDAESLYKYNQLRTEKSQHDASRDGAGPSGSDA